MYVLSGKKHGYGSTRSQVYFCFTLQLTSDVWHLPAMHSYATAVTDTNKDRNIVGIHLIPFAIIVIESPKSRWSLSQ